MVAGRVRRAKNGKPAAHPIRGDELRALRELQRHSSGGYIFETERGTPFTTDAVASASALVSLSRFTFTCMPVRRSPAGERWSPSCKAS
jgi:hypothetical protein